VKKKLRAVVWAAVSSKPQADAEKESLPEQLAEAMGYAEKMGWEVVGELTVPGHSREYIHYHAAAQSIPAYAELERLAGEQAFDVLITRGRDRLGRTDALIATAEAIVASGGAQVLSLAMPHPVGHQTDRGALIMAAIERAGAQSEIVELRRRHRSGMRGRILRGEPTNFVPFPWVKERGKHGKVTLPPERLAVARRIYELCVHDGRGLASIAGVLNRERIPPAGRGKAWYSSSVYNVLTAPFNRGVVQFSCGPGSVGDELRAESKYLPIFTPEEAAAIDAGLAARRITRRGSRARHAKNIWTGVVRCNRCDHVMGIFQVRKTWGYRCNWHYRQRSYGLDMECHANHVALWKIEEAAQEAIAALDSEEAIDAALATADGGQREAWQRQLEEVMAAGERVRAEQERLTTAYLRAILSIDVFEERMLGLAEVLDEHRQAEAELRQNLETSPDPVLRREELAVILPQAIELLTDTSLIEPAEAQKVLRLVFRAIYCEAGEVVRVVFL